MIRFRTQVTLVMMALVIATSLALGAVFISVSTRMMYRQIQGTGLAFTRVLAEELEQKRRIMERFSGISGASSPGAPESERPGPTARASESATPPAGPPPGEGPLQPGSPESPARRTDTRFEADLLELAQIIRAKRICIVMQGKVVSSVSPQVRLTSGLTDKEIRDGWQQVKDLAPETPTILESSSSVAFLTTLTPPSPDAEKLGLLVEFPKTLPRHVLIENITVLEVTLLAVFFAAIIAAWLISRNIARPISQLAETARAYGEGALDEPAPVAGPSETQHLGLALNSMAASLKQHMRSLKEETSRREQLESELRVAAALQRALLPPSGLHRFGPIEVLGWSEAAIVVGGDFYDFRSLDGNRLAVVIGDAAGHGLPAAILATKCLSVLQALAEESSAPGDLLGRANVLIAEQLERDGLFVTVFMAIIDPEGGHLAYSRAGHNPPLLARAGDGIPQALSDQAGMPLGVKADSTFETTVLEIAKGDTLLMFTDGITEMSDAAGQLYGPARLSGLFAANHGCTLPVLLENLTRDVEDHGGQQPPRDDCTVLLVRIG